MQAAAANRYPQTSSPRSGTRRTARPHWTSLQPVIEAKLVGDGLTVAQLLDAIPGLTDEERTAVATRPTALVGRLNPGAQRKLARELRALR